MQSPVTASRGRHTVETARTIGPSLFEQPGPVAVYSWQRIEGEKIKTGQRRRRASCYFSLRMGRDVQDPGY